MYAIEVSEGLCSPAQASPSCLLGSGASQQPICPGYHHMVPPCVSAFTGPFLSLKGHSGLGPTTGVSS